MDARAVATVAALDDAVRRALYAFARSSDRPITREDAACAVGISRKLAAHHLDRLVEARLLRARIETLGPRRVGRAPKVYEPVPEGVSVHIPERQPDLLASVLAEAVGAAGRSAVGRALATARKRGRDIGAQARDRLRPGRLGLERSRALTVQLLAERGFEPATEQDAVVLRNCPFHPLAAEEPELVCGLNREFVCGLTEGLQADTHLEAVLAPHPGRCCVEVRPRG
jgi:predicted ArsR family transcriptional regulator